MARPNKPTALLEATGAYNKNPARRRDNEPKPRKGIGPAPIDPATDFASVWDELVDCVCPGVLGNSDRFHLELVVHGICEFRKNPSDYPAGKWSNLSTALGRLGMNPADRAKVTADPTEKKDKVDEYFD